MPSVLHFYMDDSGTRRPNHAPLDFEHRKPQAFALGGVLIKDEDEEAVRNAYMQFCERWRIKYPLHSVDIRFGGKHFGWLRSDPDVRTGFLEDLETFLTTIPVLGLACTIDRPGYDARYRERYGRRQWHLCQTAFVISVERACKHALLLGRKLRVYPERCSKADDRRLKLYFQSMRTQGLPFDETTSAIYQPLRPEDFAATLYEINFKEKTSPLAQIADLYLWPMVRGGYCEYRPFISLMTAGRIIDCQLPAEQLAACGLKYSCFELVRAAHSEKNI